MSSRTFTRAILKKVKTPSPDLFALILQDWVSQFFLLTRQSPDLDCSCDGEGKDDVIHSVAGSKDVKRGDPVGVDPAEKRETVINHQSSEDRMRGDQPRGQLKYYCE